MAKDSKRLHEEVLSEMLKLAIGSFGLVAALAWNEFIKEIINEYIKPLVGGNSGLISLFIYALIVTILAVVVTYFLTRLVKKD